MTDPKIDPPSPPPASAQPILDYHPPDKVEARWGIPYWGQAAFGGLYFIAATIVSLFLTAIFGPASIVFIIVFLFIIPHVHKNWKWPGFFPGILLTLGLLILAMGICAIVASR